MIFFRLHHNHQMVNINQIVTITQPDPEHFMDNDYRLFMVNGRVIQLNQEEADALFRVIDIQSVETARKYANNG